MKGADPSLTLGTTEPAPRECAVGMGSGVHRQDSEARETTAAAALRAWSHRPGDMTGGAAEDPAPRATSILAGGGIWMFPDSRSLGKNSSGHPHVPSDGAGGPGVPTSYQEPFLAI